MEAYAIVKTGGKQYLVKKGDVLQVESLEAEAGGRMELATVLAISDGNALKIGTPVVEGAKVAVEVVKHMRGPKVVSFKKKRRKGYSKKIGHRQAITVLKVVGW
jgi:large subunit ribosomal protein L21